MKTTLFIIISLITTIVHATNFDTIQCFEVESSRCRARTFSCMGGYKLTLDNETVRIFLRSQKAKNECEKHKQTVKRTISILEEF